jgi:hypothetical protein
MLSDAAHLPFVTLLCGAVIFILLSFLPVFFELGKTDDAGSGKAEERVVSIEYRVQLARLERSEGVEADLLVIKKVANILFCSAEPRNLDGLPLQQEWRTSPSVAREL